MYIYTLICMYIRVYIYIHIYIDKHYWGVTNSSSSPDELAFSRSCRGWPCQFSRRQTAGSSASTDFTGAKNAVGISEFTRKKSGFHCFHPLNLGSMYGIYANIWGIWMVNVTIYSSTMDPMGYLAKNGESWNSLSRHFSPYGGSKLILEWWFWGIPILGPNLNSRTSRTIPVGMNHMKPPSGRVWLSDPAGDPSTVCTKRR